MNGTLVAVVAPHFVAGVVLGTGHCAPIISYMRSWSFQQIQGYCVSKGWHAMVIA